MGRRSFGLIIICALFNIGMSGCGKDSSGPKAASITITESKYEYTLKSGESAMLSPVIQSDNTKLSYSWLVNDVEKGTAASFLLTSELLTRGTNHITLLVSGTGDIEEEINYKVYALNTNSTKKIGYWLSYEGALQPNDNQLKNLTHFICSFWEVSADGKLQGATTNERLEELIVKVHSNGTHFFLAIGGGANSSFGECITNQEARAQLIENIISYSSTYNIDGIDIDFEAWSGGQTAGDKQKSDGLLALLSELRELLPADILLTMPVNTTEWVNYNYVPAMYQHLDWVGLMLYDYTATWQASPYGNHASYDDYVSFINYWIETKQLPKDKIVAGLPFYGYEFEDESGGLGEAKKYKEIVERYPEANTKDQIGKLFYNGQPTINKKCQYVLDNDLQGILIWEIMQDTDISNNKSLLKTVNSVIMD